ncbi:uncharacterized protein LOC141695649 [Apium graveolens]|uniref:uncharacterized protein LOC141695649 n=1 Tax=Apium graveolens TaxID=4045 RepID=UPI003D79AE3D
MTKAVRDEQWTLPTENTIKVNSDTVLFEASNHFSYSFNVSDHMGEVLVENSKYSFGTVDPANAEAIGVREVLRWIKREQYGDVVVESDYLVVVQAIRSSGILLPYFGRLIEECKSLLSELSSRNEVIKFVKWSSKKVSRFSAGILVA